MLLRAHACTHQLGEITPVLVLKRPTFILGWYIDSPCWALEYPPYEEKEKGKQEREKGERGTEGEEEEGMEKGRTEKVI